MQSCIYPSSTRTDVGKRINISAGALQVQVHAMRFNCEVNSQLLIQLKWILECKGATVIKRRNTEELERREGNNIH